MASSLLDPRASAATAPAAPAVDIRAAWRRSLLALGLLVAWILALYASTAMGMVRTWAHTETFAHGFVVPPIALWLAWRMRGVLAHTRPEPAPWALVPIAVAGAAWFLGRLAEVNAVAQFAMTGMIVLAVVAVLGVRIGRMLAFPLAFLFFAVPFGEVFLPALMDWTANFTVAALRASGIPVYREGLVFVIPSGTWSVVEACSGVRYLIASLMVGTLYAYLTYRSNRRRWLFVGFAAVVPILANWIRAYLIVLLGHLSGNRLAVGVDHLIYGWLFFAFVVVLMFWIGGRWREDGAGEARMIDGPGDDAPARGTAGGASVRAPQPWTTMIAAMLVAAAFPLAQARFDAADAAGPVVLAPIAPSAGWSAAAAGSSPWRPIFEGASAISDTRFARGDKAVGVYLAYYRNQDPDHRLVSSSNVLVRSEDRSWRRVDAGRIEDVDVGNGSTRANADEIVHASGVRFIVWKFYWIDGRLTASDAVAKVATAWARWRHDRDDAAAVIVYAPADNAEAAAPLLRAFLHDEGGAILAALAATRKRR
jgi:exosortase A